jgi:hypothetical protein
MDKLIFIVAEADEGALTIHQLGNLNINPIITFFYTVFISLETL